MFSEKVSHDDILPVDSLSAKVKILESDTLECDNQAKYDLEKREISASKTEQLPSPSDKDAAQAKTRNSAAKLRQTQSGPLNPGIVLSHSQSERMRNFERFISECELFCPVLFIYMGGGGGGG